MAVQKAATEFGIPSGTLYGRCKKVGIELSKNTQVRAGPSTDIRHCHLDWDQYQYTPQMSAVKSQYTLQVHWSEDDMTMALDSVRTGNMSINQVTRTRQRVSSVL